MSSLFDDDGPEPQTPAADAATATSDALPGA